MKLSPKDAKRILLGLTPGQRIDMAMVYPAITVAVAALDLPIAKHPVYSQRHLTGKMGSWNCPSCRREVSSLFSRCECGQKLDWSNINGYKQSD